MKTCQETHPVCKALCCKIVTFTVMDPQARELIFKNLHTQTIHYYKLHGFDIKRLGNRMWQVTIPGQFTVKTVQVGKRFKLIVHARCGALTEDLLCQLHGTDMKPQVCTYLTDETAKEGKYHITEGCKYERI